MMRRGIFLVVALSSLVCGCSVARGGSDAGGSGSWRTSTDPVSTSGLIWAAGSTVHFADGTTIETGSPVDTFVVAGDGVFFLPPNDEDDQGSDGSPSRQLQFAAPGESPINTGVRTSLRMLAASPDGRYLVALDLGSGKRDKFGTPQASEVAFDLETGEQVVDSTLGMGDPDVDDFADLYSESEIEISSVTDTKAYVRAYGDFVFDLETGQGREMKEGEEPEPPGGDLLVSPDGKWTLEQPETGPSRILGRDGERVTPSTGGSRWNLYWWADDRTAVGTLITGPHTGNRVMAGDAGVLMSCEVPSGECEVFTETSGQTVFFPVGASIGNGVSYQDGHES